MLVVFSPIFVADTKTTSIYKIAAIQIFWATFNF